MPIDASVAWSPNGKTIAFECEPSSIAQARGQLGRILALDLASGALLTISPVAEVPRSPSRRAGLATTEDDESLSSTACRCKDNDHRDQRLTHRNRPRRRARRRTLLHGVSPQVSGTKLNPMQSSRSSARPLPWDPRNTEDAANLFVMGWNGSGLTQITHSEPARPARRAAELDARRWSASSSPTSAAPIRAARRCHDRGRRSDLQAPPPGTPAQTHAHVHGRADRGSAASRADEVGVEVVAALGTTVCHRS